MESREEIVKLQLKRIPLKMMNLLKKKIVNLMKILNKFLSFS